MSKGLIMTHMSVSSGSSVDPASAKPRTSRSKSFISGLSIRFRLAVIVGLFFIPLSVLVTLFEIQANKDISFSSRERDGIVYMKELWPIYRSLIEGGAGLPAVGVTTENLARLSEVSQRFDESFNSTAQAKAFAEALQAARWPVPSLASAEQRATAVAAARALITQIGDGSNLILDPELDTYYLMDLIIIRHVEALHTVLDLQGFIEGTRRSRNFDGPRRSRFLQSLGRLKSAIDGIENSAATAAARNASGLVAARISPPLKQLLATH